MARGSTMEPNATREETPPPSAVDTVSRPAATKINGSGTLRQGDEIFGRLIAVRRAALGLSREDLAAKMDTSKANVAGIENGLPPRLETLERLAAVLAAEPRTGAAWRFSRGGWRWGGVAIAILVPALVILNGRSGETDGDASSVRPPVAGFPAPAAAAPVLRADAQANPGNETRTATKTQKPKATPQRERGAATGEEPRQPAPEATLAPTSPTTSPAKPAPEPPSAAVSPQPSGSDSPSGSLKPTGKPEGTPGNGPGGSGGSGGGNGPSGTGPPGQLR